MEVIQKMEKIETLKKIIEKTKEAEISDSQRKAIYSYASQVSKDTITEVCPALIRVLLISEKGALKNELGRVIFHLQKTERLNTLIGLQKLLDASLIVAPEEMFKTLESSGKEAEVLAQKIMDTLKK